MATFLTANNFHGRHINAAHIVDIDVRYDADNPPSYNHHVEATVAGESIILYSASTYVAQHIAQRIAERIVEVEKAGGGIIDVNAIGDKTVEEKGD